MSLNEIIDELKERNVFTPELGERIDNVYTTTHSKVSAITDDYKRAAYRAEDAVKSTMLEVYNVQLRYDPVLNYMSKASSYNTTR